MLSTPEGTVTEATCPEGTYGETMTLPTCVLVALSKIWKVPLTLSPLASTNVSRSVGVTVLTV